MFRRFLNIQAVVFCAEYKKDHSRTHKISCWKSKKIAFIARREKTLNLRLREWLSKATYSVYYTIYSDNFNKAWFRTFDWMYTRVTLFLTLRSAQCEFTKPSRNWKTPSFLESVGFFLFFGSLVLGFFLFFRPPILYTASFSSSTSRPGSQH